MKKVLVVGAGRTAISLISYLYKQAEKQNWEITVVDQSKKLIEDKIKNYPGIKAVSFDVNNAAMRKRVISRVDVVVSLVPPELHLKLAKDCLEGKTHLVTASYISGGMKKLHKDTSASGLIMLNEMGLDPGIDHMDTMRLLSKIKKKGGNVYSLKSYGGGLITPESDDNPWGYKITWNPMNIVRAGTVGARYVENGRLKIVPYNRIFLDTEIVDVPGLGKYESYPNRDSIKYRKIYNLPGLQNVYRGSLRKIGFCDAWNALVKIGLTDNAYIVPGSKNLTYKEWLSTYLGIKNGTTTRKALSKFLGNPSNGKIVKKLEWLGILSNERIKLSEVTPAQILLNLIKQKWAFKKADRDMIILQTEIKYRISNKKEKMRSSLVVKGDDFNHTAMAKTVGLPLGIGVNLILNERIKRRGVIIPTHKEIYQPVLKELSESGIKFTEEITSIS